MSQQSNKFATLFPINEVDFHFIDEKAYEFYHEQGRKYGIFAKFYWQEMFLFDFLPEKGRKKLRNRISDSF